MHIDELIGRGRTALDLGRAIEALFLLGSAWLLSPESPERERDLDRCVAAGAKLSTLSNLSKLQVVEVDGDPQPYVVSAWVVGTALYARQNARDGDPWAAIDLLLTLFRHDPTLPLLERGLTWLDACPDAPMDSDDVLILRLVGVGSWGVGPLACPLPDEDRAIRSLQALLRLLIRMETGSKEVRVHADLLASAILLRLNQIPLAIHRAARAVTRRRTPESLACLAVAHRAAGQLTPALAAFSAAAELCPSHMCDPVPHWENAGDCARLLRRYPEAAKWYRLVLARRPNNVRAAAYVRFSEMSIHQPTVGSAWDYHPDATITQQNL